MIEDIHIVDPQPAQGLVQAGQQILAAAEVAIGPGPHFISGLGGDDHLIPVGQEVFLQDAAKVDFCAAGLRAIVVGQVKVGNAQVKGSAADFLHIVIAACIPEIMPQAQRNSRKLQAAFAAAAIKHGVVTGGRCLIHGGLLLSDFSLFYRISPEMSLVYFRSFHAKIGLSRLIMIQSAADMTLRGG